MPTERRAHCRPDVRRSRVADTITAAADASAAMSAIVVCGARMAAP